jgi:hypothetical protein
MEHPHCQRQEEGVLTPVKTAAFLTGVNLGGRTLWAGDSRISRGFRPANAATSLTAVKSVATILTAAATVVGNADQRPKTRPKVKEGCAPARARLLTDIDQNVEIFRRCLIRARFQKKATSTKKFVQTPAP